MEVFRCKTKHSRQDVDFERTAAPRLSFIWRQCFAQRYGPRARQPEVGGNKMYPLGVVDFTAKYVRRMSIACRVAVEGGRRSRAGRQEQILRPEAEEGGFDVANSLGRRRCHRPIEDRLQQGGPAVSTSPLCAHLSWLRSRGTRWSLNSPVGM